MDEIQYGQLTPAAAQPGADGGLDRLRDVPVDLVVEIGRARMTIGEALKLSPGKVIGLNRLAGDPVNLLVNGKPIARGEVVVVDEEFGLRVTEVVSEPGVVSGEPAASEVERSAVEPGVVSGEPAASTEEPEAEAAA